MAASILSHLSNDYLFLDEDSSSATSASEPLSTFSKFPELPPEIRYAIYLAALPEPGAGINFFNIHCIPNDHPGANRSTSPAWLYLDLRRLDIEDSDADVFEYDPSVWQARNALCRVCREARALCSIPKDKAVDIVLTRPKRGLFVRAGDGQLIKLTPYQCPTPNKTGADTDADGETSDQDAHRDVGAPAQSGEEVGTGPEQLVRRTIKIHRDDILSLSFENCSFNLAYEEFEYDLDRPELGWAYDPQLTPALSPAIPLDKICISMARSRREILLAVDQVRPGLFRRHPDVPYYEHVMFDARVIDRKQMPTCENVFRDRFEDVYVPRPSDLQVAESLPEGHSSPVNIAYYPLGGKYRLTKLSPESPNDTRARYLRSALLQSPKRPVIDDMTLIDPFYSPSTL
ncbi:hypothetical protein F5B20DRAFT_550074 [Whalleya microplaca]|nr:hypothetical protein F5B20DRAFT_550074 [Whalleya microplaca]